MEINSQNKTVKWWGNAGTYALLVFLGVAAFFLFTEHRAHLFGALPYLLLLTLPFTHLFMHGSHGKHGNNINNQEQQSLDSTHPH